jgi:cytochrome c553
MPIHVPRMLVPLAAAAVLSLAYGFAHASAESVDRRTQAALALDAHPDRGAAHFAQYCVRCHGPQGQGDSGRAIPALAGQRFVYLIRQLADFAGAERESDTMHGVLSQQDLRGPQTWVDIAAFLNRTPVVVRAQTGDGAHAALGRGIFHEQCASCHKSDAHGDAFVPSLRNQHYGYLLEQMHKLREGYRHNADEGLVRFLRSFTEPDMMATADYLSRLRGPGATHPTMRDDGIVVD